MTQEAGIPNLSAASEVVGEPEQRPPRFLTLRAAAALLDVHPNAVRAHAREGKLPGAKVGRDWRFLEADLVAWMRAQYPDGARMQPSAQDKEAT